MGTVSLMQSGKVLFEGACGFANAEWEVPNTIDTKFRTGSIAKQFTAASILLLKQTGKLKLDDPISKFVPDLPTPWRDATIHQLLTHTSGIPSYTASADSAALQRLNRRGATPDQLLALVKARPLLFPHGTRMAYNNTGYVLLGLVIEKVSSARYRQFVQEKLLTPAQMRDSGFDDAQTVLARRASGYARKQGHLENAESVDASVAWSSGGFYSTVRDLQTWWRFLTTGALLDADSLARMFRIYPETLTAGLHYGYAVVLGQKHGTAVRYHGGGISGYSSVLQHYPAHNLTVAVMSNLDSDSEATAAWTVADGLVEQLLDR